MNLNLAQRFALAEFLAKHFAAVRKEELNPEAVQDMEPGERYAAKFAGKRAAWVSLSKPAMRAKVTDERALVKWAKEHMPEEVVTVEQVRPGTLKVLQDAMKAHGGLVDKQTGEVTPVPGIEVSEGDPSPRVVLEDDAAGAIAAAWRAGDIDPALLLALPAVPDEREAA